MEQGDAAGLQIIACKFMKYCVLNVPLSDDVYEFHTDASGLGVGCVLNVCRVEKHYQSLSIVASCEGQSTVILLQSWRHWQSLNRSNISTTSCTGGDLLLSLTTSH